jgi:hypothetical protein
MPTLHWTICAITFFFYQNITILWLVCTQFYTNNNVLLCLAKLFAVQIAVQIAQSSLTFSNWCQNYKNSSLLSFCSSTSAWVCTTTWNIWVNAHNVCVCASIIIFDTSFVLPIQPRGCTFCHATGEWRASPMCVYHLFFCFTATLPFFMQER